MYRFEHWKEGKVGQSARWRWKEAEKNRREISLNYIEVNKTWGRSTKKIRCEEDLDKNRPPWCIEDNEHWESEQSGKSSLAKEKDVDQEGRMVNTFRKYPVAWFFM